ncbi:MAG: exopolysaccharide biosynthesis protein [Devosia sp.]|uniref:sugar transferase n=1 Tax=Devosia sp. TaxID=1871048 RepID=UPI0026020B67|nr:sugar transferase [Devosia sp.]MDB5540895.1 exopolysaccharide biosynthesis protein [Devosia sp.]
MRVALSSEMGGVARRVERLGRPKHHKLQNGLPLALENGVPLLPDPISPSPAYDVCKRLFDLAAAFLALLFLGPMLLLLALAIKFSSPGPALFRQWRVGRNGKPFMIFKFRTMHMDAADTAGLRQVTVNDRGVTPLGRLMRAKSVDELPQLLNVLLGHMSVIGPRPHPVGMLAAGVPYETLVPYYHRRHAVRPGLSGWAQANGLRGPTTDAQAARDRIDHDLAYIQNQSLLLDAKIIALTIKHEFLTGSGV